MKNNYCAYVDKGIRLKLFDKIDGTYANIKPCCHLDYRLIPQDIDKHIKIESAKDIMNVMPLRYFRDFFESNNNLHPACLACNNYENKNLESPRIYVNKLNYSGYDINRLDVVLGNSCNLACPFCSSYASSLIDKLSNKLDTNDRPQSWIPLNNIIDATGSQKTAEIISEILKNYKVHTLKLIGGEPFLKENWNKIAEVIDKDYCRDLHLEITTNGTVLNDEIFSRFNKIKNVQLGISIDSIGSNYEFIRWPHTWKKMESNIEYLKTTIPFYNNVNVNVSNLVNIFNFEFLPEIENYFWNYRDIVDYSLEIKPSTHLMNYQNLPEHIINTVKNKIQTDNLRNAISIGTNNYSKEQLKHEFDVLLAQRNMKASDVIGPMTCAYFGLTK